MYVRICALLYPLLSQKNPDILINRKQAGLINCTSRNSPISQLHLLYPGEVLNRTEGIFLLLDVQIPMSLRVTPVEIGRAHV